MSPWVLMLLLKPFIAFVIMITFVAIPKYLFCRFYPEGRIKRLLLTRLS
jgi:hypothetical protein